MNDQRAGPDPVGADQPQRSRLDLNAVTDEVLPALIARLRASHLGELEVAGEGWRVRLRRAPESPRHDADAVGAVDGGLRGGLGRGDTMARSPGVGYFQPASELRMGASVEAGDVLGSVDVLGIVQDVTAPTTGIVGRVLAEDGQAVEYGQALAEVEPLEPDRDAHEGVAG